MNTRRKEPLGIERWNHDTHPWLKFTIFGIVGGNRHGSSKPRARLPRVTGGAGWRSGGAKRHLLSQHAYPTKETARKAISKQTKHQIRKPHHRQRANDGVDEANGTGDRSATDLYFDVALHLGWNAKNPCKSNLWANCRGLGMASIGLEPILLLGNGF